MDRIDRITALALDLWEAAGGDRREAMGDAWILASRIAKRGSAPAVLARMVFSSLAVDPDVEPMCPEAALGLTCDPSPERHAADRELSSRVGRVMLQRLTPREERALRLRNGFHGEPLALWQTGKELGVGTERARAIEQKAMRKMRFRDAWPILEPVLPDACRAYIVDKRCRDALHAQEHRARLAARWRKEHQDNEPDAPDALHRAA